MVVMYGQNYSDNATPDVPRYKRKKMTKINRINTSKNKLKKDEGKKGVGLEAL